MYRYVSMAEVRQYKEFCEQVFKKVQRELKKRYAITFQFSLIGSGAKNMITRDGKGPFDLDYNIELMKLPLKYQQNPQQLKELIRLELNKCMGERFSYGKDSTAVLRYLLQGANGAVKFSIDIAILWHSPAGVQRLIHDRKTERYIWNEIKDFSQVLVRAKEISKAKQRNCLRERYLTLKNEYLRRGERLHSYLVYVAAVNDIYQSLEEQRK